MGKSQLCFFCETECEVDTMPSRHRINQYECPCCGIYLLIKSTNVYDVDIEDAENKFKIACLLNERRLQGKDKVSLVRKSDANEIIEGFSVISIVDLINEFPQKASDLVARSLLNLSRLVNQPFDHIELTLEPVGKYNLFSQEGPQADLLLRELERQGWVSSWGDSNCWEFWSFTLTTKCWEMVENLPQADYPKPIKDKKGSAETGQKNKTVFSSPKFTDKNGNVFEGSEALKKMWEKFLEFGRYTIPEKPFSGKPITITDNNYRPTKGYRELLTEEERELLLKAMPELSDAGLEAVLRRIYNMGDERIKILTWEQIFTFCKDYINNLKPDESTGIGRKKKEMKNEQEGYLEPKPPEFLQKMLWVLKHGTKHWKIILLALFVLGIPFGLKFNLHGKAFSLLTKKTTSYSGQTQLYPRTKKRVDDFYKSIRNEKLDPWLFINVEGVKVRITKYNGDIINYSGIMFTGSPRVVFWSDDFIPPFIEDAIIKVFDQTIEECRKNNLDPEVYIYEAKRILSDFIYKIYNHMAGMDQKLLKEAHPESSGRRDVTLEIEKMCKCLDEQYNAALLLASGNENVK